MDTEESILETVGETPLVHVETLSHGNADVYAKIDGFDPTGSIKGRVAKRMVEEAEESGELTQDKTLIEPTSGNTGIALAMVASFKGYDSVFVMPAEMSVERLLILKSLDADVILTPPEDGEDGAINKAREIVSENPGKYWMPDQFSNEYNVKEHYEETGPEIWEQTGGNVTHFVAAWGTSGTLVGVGKYLKDRDSSVEVVGIEPESCEIQGLKNFENGITPEIYNDDVVDRVEEVAKEEAWEMTDRLVKQESMFMGQSSGANAAVAERLAEELDDAVIVTTFADFGFKYLSSEPYCSEELEQQLEEARQTGETTRI